MAVCEIWSPRSLDKVTHTGPVPSERNLVGEMGYSWRRMYTSQAKEVAYLAQLLHFALLVDHVEFQPVVSQPTGGDYCSFFQMSSLEHQTAQQLAGGES